MKRLGFFSAAILLALLINGPSAVQAQADAETFTLQPGGTATITFEAFCTEFGEVFASAVQEPSGPAPDNVRAALAYGVDQGLNANGQQALQLQFAIWQALGEPNSPAGDTIAKDVLANGTAAPANPQGTSLLDAAQARQVSLKVDSWQPIGAKVAITATATDNFYGRGQLTVSNISQQELTLFMPVGTLFPSVNPAEQTMAGYATNIQVNNPAPVVQQLPATGGSASGSVLLLVALALLASSAALHFGRYRAR